ncbi:MAG TPA: FAD-dependent oxidoreductase [Negativicutes bacterium]|nr:FAD-dependent oxidoreductase [Negativicutes bacterium]
MHDLIIIGGGPAGMTAAVYAARKRMDTVLITKDLGGQMMWTREIENYLGFQYITGPELIAKFEEHLRRYPADIVYDEVTKLEQAGDGTFRVYCGEREHRARTVIVASGKRPRRLGVTGEEKYTGRGVGYCATCDGPLYAGKTVAVVGGGNSALQAAIELAGIASGVYLVVRGGIRADPVVVDKLRSIAGVEVLEGYVAGGIYGGETVERFTVAAREDGRERTLAVQGVFVEIGLDPNSEFIVGVTDLNEYGEIEVDCRTATGVPGLFAAGDVASGPDKQIIIAAGDGAKAALVAYEYLLHKR